MSDTTDPIDLADALNTFGSNLAALQPTFVPPSLVARSASPRPLKLIDFDGAAYVRARVAIEAAADSGQGLEIDGADIQALTLGLALASCAIAYNGAPPFLANDASKHAPFKSTSLGGASPDDRDGHYVVAPFGHVLGAVHPEYRKVISFLGFALKRLPKSPTSPKSGVSYLPAPSVDKAAAFANAPIFTAAPLLVFACAALAALTVYGSVRYYVDAEVVKAANQAGKAAEAIALNMKLKSDAGQSPDPDPGLVALLGITGKTGAGAQPMSFWDFAVPAGIAVGVGAGLAFGLSLFNKLKNERKKDQKAA